ncbi:hypothetical protein [Salsuginibacillus halophilus]|uniref:hypothetical protein n=1 Tax=Salsuginibacillus halophilus TaxID=517424 RepID=UPI0015E79CA6|nr:hypothetical protein [Salsuginibacillus halophilus]
MARPVLRDWGKMCAAVAVTARLGQNVRGWVWLLRDWGKMCAIGAATARLSRNVRGWGE